MNNLNVVLGGKRRVAFVPTALVLVACLCCVVAAPAFAKPVLLDHSSVVLTAGASTPYSVPAGNNRMVVVTIGTLAVGHPDTFGAVAIATVTSTLGTVVKAQGNETVNSGTTTRVGCHEFYIWMGDSAAVQSTTLSCSALHSQIWHISTFGNMDNAVPPAANKNGSALTGTTLTTNAIATTSTDYLVVVQAASQYWIAGSSVLTSTAPPGMVTFNNRNSYNDTQGTNACTSAQGYIVQPAAGSVTYTYTIPTPSKPWAACGVSYKSKYRVSATAGTGGSLQDGSSAVWADGSFDHDSPVTIVAVPSPGYYFVRWEANNAPQSEVVPYGPGADNWVTVGSASTTYTFNAGWKNDDQATTLNRNGHAVRAVFGPRAYSVTFDADGGTPATTIQSETYNAAYVLPFDPTRAGCTFAGWWTAQYGGGTQVTAATTVTNTADHTLYAKWTATVTFDAPGGVVVPASKTVTIGTPYGALPKPSYAVGKFGGWYTGPGRTGVLVTAATTVTAAGDHTLHDYYIANPVAITVTADADGKFYGDADPALTYTVVPPLNPGDSMTGALERAPGEVVGVYAIGQGTLDSPVEYDITFAGANFTIGPKPLTVTANADGKPYGAVDPALTYAITSGALVGSDTMSGELVRAAGETVAGSPYAISQGTVTAGGNYAITFVPANFTIAPKVLTVTITNNPIKLYDGNTSASLTSDNYSVSGLVGADSVTVTRTVGEYASSAVGGPILITVTLSGTDFTPGFGTVLANYALPTTATGYGTITDKQIPNISVWPTASAITFGQALSASTLSSISPPVAGTFAFTIPGTIPPGVGVYVASVTFTPQNTTSWATVSHNVNVTVKKATPAIQPLPAATNIVLGQALSKSTLSGGAAKNPFGAASVAGGFAFTAPATIPSSVGIYNASVTFTPVDTTNYNAAVFTVGVTVLTPGLHVQAVTVLEKSIVVNNAATFEVSVVGETGTAHLQWYTTAGGAGWALMPGEESEMLMIGPALETDTGQYKCVVWDEVVTVDAPQTPVFTLRVFAGMPVAGLAGLAALAAAFGLGGATLQRRRK